MSSHPVSRPVKPVFILLWFFSSQKSSAFKMFPAGWSVRGSREARYSKILTKNMPTGPGQNQLHRPSSNLNGLREHDAVKEMERTFRPG